MFPGKVYERRFFKLALYLSAVYFLHIAGTPTVLAETEVFGKRPLTVDNIPLEDIESALEGETEYSEGCSSMFAFSEPATFRVSAAFLYMFFVLTTFLLLP